MKHKLRVDGLNFDQWKEQVDGLLSEQTEFGIDHWADGPTAYEFEAGTTPNEYAFDILPEHDEFLKQALTGREWGPL